MRYVIFILLISCGPPYNIKDKMESYKRDLEACRANRALEAELTRECYYECKEWE